MSLFHIHGIVTVTVLCVSISQYYIAYEFLCLVVRASLKKLQFEKFFQCRIAQLLRKAKGYILSHYDQMERPFYLITTTVSVVSMMKCVKRNKIDIRLY